MNKQEISFVLGFLGFILTLLYILDNRYENQKKSCQDVGAVRYQIHKGYLCVRDGLIIDPKTGKVFGRP